MSAVRCYVPLNVVVQNLQSSAALPDRALWLIETAHCEIDSRGAMRWLGVAPGDIGGFRHTQHKYPRMKDKPSLSGRRKLKQALAAEYAVLRNLKNMSINKGDAHAETFADLTRRWQSEDDIRLDVEATMMEQRFERQRTAREEGVASKTRPNQPPGPRHASTSARGQATRARDEAHSAYIRWQGSQGKAAARAAMMNKQTRLNTDSVTEAVAAGRDSSNTRFQRPVDSQRPARARKRPSRPGSQW